MNIKKVLGASLVAAFAIASVAGATTYTFTKTLKQGSKGADVKNLQKFLNECPDTKVTAAGKETTTFGAGTKKAVIAFQKKNSLPATGTFGSLSAAAAVKAQAATDVCAPVVSGSTTPSTGGTTPVISQTGPVTVALSSDNPAAGTIVAGQATADLMHVTFTGTGTVNSVTLSRGGISDSSTLSSVYLYDGVTRLTDGYSFNTAGTLTINNLNLAVNGSKTISVKADVYLGTSSYDIYTTLTGFTVGTSASTVAIKGNDFYVASGTGTLASISLSGSQQVSTNASVNAGQTNYAVWRQAFQVNTRALNLKAANFRISGSAPADALANVGLYIDGVKTGNNASMTAMNGSNYLSFDMSAMPVSLSTGTHTVEVRADVVKGSSFSFTVSLQQASDLMVMDPQVGVNLTISSFTASSAGTITIGAGSYTVNNDVKFNSLTNVTAGISNAVIAKYTVHGYGEDVKVTSIAVTPVLAGTVTPGGAAGLQNVALFFNGSQIGANTANWTSGAITFTPGSQLMIPANADSIIEVHADLRNTNGVSYTGGIVSANLGSIVSEGFNSHSNVTAPALPSGHTLTMQAGALTVAKNGNYSNQTISSNAMDQKIGSFVFQNTSSSDSVRVTSLLVNPIGAGTALTTDIAGLKVSGTFSDGTVAFAPTAPQQPASSNTYSVDFTLTPGQTATVDLIASTNSNNGETVIPTLVATAISSNIGVSQNGNGTAVVGQTITINSGSLTNLATTPSFLASNSTPTSYLASPAGKVDATKATYSFSATGGAVTISELKFQVTGSDATPSNTVTNVKVGTVSAPVVGGVAWLQNLSIPVANGGTGTNLNAYISYATVGQAGTASVLTDKTSSVALYMVKYTSGGVTTTLGNGGTAFTNGSLSSSTITLVAATPTVKKTSSPTSVGVGTTSNLKVGTIAITANDGDVSVYSIPVSFSSLGSNANWTVKVNGTAPAGITQPTTNVSGFSFASGYQISKGNTVSFDLYADVTNNGTSSGNVDVSLGANASFKWSDIVDGATSVGSTTKTGTNLTTYNQ